MDSESEAIFNLKLQIEQLQVRIRSHLQWITSLVVT
jgi:hypothetical protein